MDEQETKTADQQAAPPQAVQRSAPKAGEETYRNCELTVRRSSDGKRSEIVINTSALDTYGTIIEPDGCDLSRYQRNPIVLINHDRWAVAGRSTVSLRNGQLVAVMGEDDWDLEDEFVRIWHNKFVRGFVRGASIGFIPLEWREEKDEANGYYYRITKWELTEWSIVTIPSNPDALVLSRSNPAAPKDIETLIRSVLRQELQTIRAANPAPTTGSAPDAEPPAEERSADEAAPVAVPDEAARSTEPAPKPVQQVREATPAEYAALISDLLPVIDQSIMRHLGRC